MCDILSCGKHGLVGPLEALSRLRGFLRARLVDNRWAPQFATCLVYVFWDILGELILCASFHFAGVAEECAVNAPNGQNANLHACVGHFSALPEVLPKTGVSPADLYFTLLSHAGHGGRLIDTFPESAG